jgi:hypothetical protein
MNLINMRLLSHKIFLLFTFGILLLVPACEKDELEPLYNKGVLTGTITLDSWLGEPAADVIVKASGPYGTKSVLTNSGGIYEMSGLGNGTYEVEFTKEGWGAPKHYSVQIYGNDTISITERLLKCPDFVMPLLYLEADPDYLSIIEFRSNLPVNTTEVPPLRAFISKTKDVSCFKYACSAQAYDYTTEEYVYYTFGFHYPQGFTSGEKAFLIAYLCNENDYGYIDYFKGIEVFSTINVKKHSPVIEIKIP